MFIQDGSWALPDSRLDKCIGIQSEAIERLLIECGAKSLGMLNPDSNAHLRRFQFIKAFEMSRRGALHGEHFAPGPTTKLTENINTCCVGTEYATKCNTVYYRP